MSVVLCRSSWIVLRS